MSQFKKNLEIQLGKGKTFYIHTSEHQYKFSLKKIHTETKKEEKVMEWNPSKATVLKTGAGIGVTVPIVANWISSLF